MVAVEAAGGLESVVAASLGAAGLLVVVVNPAQVRCFANVPGKRAKTDQIDAAQCPRGGIARFAQATKPAIRPLADADTTALADRIARRWAQRGQIIQMITAEGQREKRASARLEKSIQRLRKALPKELSEIGRHIATRRFVARRCGATTLRNPASPPGDRRRRSPTAPRPARPTGIVSRPTATRRASAAAEAREPWPKHGARGGTRLGSPFLRRAEDY